MNDVKGLLMQYDQFIKLNLKKTNFVLNFYRSELVLNGCL